MKNVKYMKKPNMQRLVKSFCKKMPQSVKGYKNATILPVIWQGWGEHGKKGFLAIGGVLDENDNFVKESEMGDRHLGLGNYPLERERE